MLPGDPDEVGGHRLEGRLGSGGQGVVYLGRTADGAPVAVKILHQDWAAEEDTRRRLAGEIAAARRVAPFCIAQVIDADVTGPRPYIVSEYVDGPSLQEAAPRSGGALHRLAVGTATALAAVHRAGVVHRDFKPANVLLGSDGPRVVDFGIARRLDASTTSGDVVGTIPFMAPEQIAGEPAGPASDVFSWGCVMVFAATRRPPFGEDTVPAVLNRVLHREPDLGDLAEPLRGIVADALRKDPAGRPTMFDITMRLLSVAGEDPVPGSPYGTALPPGTTPGETRPAAPTVPSPGGHVTLPRPYGTGGRRRRLLMGAASGVLALAATAGALLARSVEAGNSPAPSESGSGQGVTAADTPAPPPSPAVSPSPTASPSATASPTVLAQGTEPATENTDPPVETTRRPKPASFPAGFAGTWRGPVDYDPGAEDRLVVTITKGGTTITERFLDYRCTGTSAIKEVSGTVVRLKRTGMRGNCVHNGEIHLTLNPDGTLSFEYAGRGENEYTKNVKFFMHATLHRDP
ncbi:serine/threonine protein kinase [Sphaerimonospora sp. CA-214678]|uniref:serine/threonine protein kinase n=1 Tax=Sphaerimonospora sp. CA-214678 TaxID=3240029 RepID=UPI003D923724